jgi:hypothetical protein
VRDQLRCGISGVGRYHDCRLVSEPYRANCDVLLALPLHDDRSGRDLARASFTETAVEGVRMCTVHNVAREATEALRTGIAGEVFVPGDPGYDEARQT